ncbi:MAG: hypothetical protein ACHP7N_11080 [Caulobacterales bacterium]
MQVAARLIRAASLAAIALTTGCSPQAGGDIHRAATDPSAAGERGYVPPPELTGAARTGQGVDLAGTANPGAEVRLASPKGAVLVARADAKGGWRLTAPASSEPRLLGLSMSDHGRIAQAKGYLFLAPDGEAARLRAGGGSEALAGAAPGLIAAAHDYDDQRAATLSGRAAPGEAVSLRVDGVERGQASADAERRFVLPLNQPLSPGAHDFDLSGAGGETHFTANIAAPAPLAGSPFRASREAAGWRVDWLTPGGGEQTTLIFDPAEPRA